MENRNYIVCRDDIHVGAVVKTDSIYEKSTTNNDKPRLTTGSWRHYRSMIFVPNEKNLSNDLLYKSPSYPILNVTDDDICLNLTGKNIVIKRACNLAPLLKYFDFKEMLDYKDILKIRKMFFTGTFAQDNCELFGMKEVMAEHLTFYSQSGREITDRREIEKRRREFRAEQKAGHRQFNSVSESPLPRRYWDILDELGDNTLKDVLDGYEDRINAFTPHQNEGPVKKLTRF